MLIGQLKDSLAFHYNILLTDKIYTKARLHGPAMIGGVKRSLTPIRNIPLLKLQFQALLVARLVDARSELAMHLMYSRYHVIHVVFQYFDIYHVV